MLTNEFRDLAAMGYRRYGHLSLLCWAKPVGRSIFVYQALENKIGLYFMGKMRLLCWESQVFEKTTTFLHFLQNFEESSFHANGMDIEQDFSFLENNRDILDIL